jgi:hypothetical protein
MHMHRLSKSWQPHGISLRCLRFSAKWWMVGLLALGFGDLLQAQAPPFEWVRRVGGLSGDQAAAITVDGAGNLYLTGAVQDRITFGSDTIGRSGNWSDQMFVAKLDTMGNPIWARAASITTPSSSYVVGLSISVDSSGAIYIAGLFEGTATFGTITLTAQNQDSYVAKYSSTGNVLWAKRFGSSRAIGNDPQSDWAAVAVAPDDAIYVTGAFEGTLVLGTNTLTSAGSKDIFHAKLDSSGNIVWVRKSGGVDDDVGTAVAGDAAGNSYLAGGFDGPANFGGIAVTGHPQSGAMNIWWPSTFIAKYDATGSILWVRQVSTNLDVGRVRSVTIDAQGAAYLAGDIWQATVANFTYNPSNARYFAAKVEDPGRVTWQIQGGGGAYDYQNPPYVGNSISLDSSGNLFLTGYFIGSFSIGSTNLVSEGDRDIFAMKFNSQGSVVWVKQAGLVFRDSANGVSVDVNGNAYLCGSFYDSTRFDSTNLSGNSDDVFLAKLPAIAPVAPTITTQPQSQSVLERSNVVFSVVAAGTDPLIYQWQLNGSSLSGRTNFSLTITNVQATNQGDYRVIVSNLGGSVTSVVATLMVAYLPSFTNQPQSQIVPAGTNAVLSVLAGGTQPLRFQWRLNGTNVVNATNAVLVVSNAQPVNGGNYTVVVTNDHGAVTSSIASLMVRYLLTVNIVGTGTVTRNPTGDLYPPNFAVSLAASPGAGYAFNLWSGDAIGDANPLSITMTSNKTVQANFSSTAVTIAIQGQGTVSKAPDKAFYAVGEQVTLSAMPAHWFEFSSWGDGSTANPRVITIGPSNSYSVIFSPTTALETVTFGNATRTAPVGMPIIFVDGEFVITTEITQLGDAEIAMQTTFPNGTILFTLDGTEPTAFSYLYVGPFTINRTRTIRAVAYDAEFANSWEADPIEVTIVPTYSVFATTTGGGSISVSPTNPDFPSNTVATITATPNPGWSLLQWLGDAQGTNPVVTLLMDADRCVEAIFGTTLGTTASGNGSVAIDPVAAMYPYGWTVALTAIPQNGNAFAVWGDSGRGTNNPLLFKVTNANVNVSALFAASPAGQYSLAVRASGAGEVTITPRANRYTNGQTVELIAVADTGQEFRRWSGQANGTQNPMYLTIAQDTVMTALFTRKATLSVSDCGSGHATEAFRVILTGHLRDRFGIEISSDLVTWSPERDVTNAFGRMQLDLPLTNGANRFYRARLKED